MGDVETICLQKIASLEKELVVELEEEQERKRQLEAIEELTRAIHSPVYKPDSWRRLQSSNSSSRKGYQFPIHLYEAHMIS